LADLNLLGLRGQLLARYADAVQQLPASQRVELGDQAVRGNF
jgi:hypothetical protein